MLLVTTVPNEPSYIVYYSKNDFVHNLMSNALAIIDNSAKAEEEKLKTATAVCASCMCYTEACATVRCACILQKMLAAQQEK